MDSCQICFEPATSGESLVAADPIDIDTSTATPTDTDTATPTEAATLLVRKLCGAACPAIVCASCLAAHVRASLDDCYAGVLPRVRCPICLTRLNKTQWAPHLPVRGTTDDDSTSAEQLVGRYKTFCLKACSLQSPCCHKVDYSHLPDASLCESEVAIDAIDTPATNSSTDIPTDADGDDATDATEPQPAPEPAAAEFLARCRAFCFHRGDDGRALVQFALKQFAPHGKDESTDPAKTAKTVVDAALARIADDERRATLLLSFLYAQPAAYTWCCQRAFCFNCKRNGHHAVCERESDVIDEDKCIARCRSCRVMIVKVEGCDSVVCVCGYAMGWTREVEIHRLSRRGLVPVDIFDHQLHSLWEQWRAKAQRWVAQLKKQAYERHRRAWIVKYAPLMRRCFGAFIWRLQAERRHSALQRELFWCVYDRAHPENKTDADDFTAALFAINV